MDSAKKSGVKRKHHALSIAQKVEILKKLDSGMSVQTICDIYDIGSSTVYDIKKRKEKLLKFFSDSGSKQQMFVRKSMAEGKSSELDQVLITWFNLRVREGVEMSGDLIKKQAKAFHEQLGLQHKCDYSEGWLQRFKSRHGIQFSALFGEKRSADIDVASEYVDEFAKLVSDEHLSPEQVYNADETALLWRCTPKKTTEDAESPSEFKASKDRVTVMCCSNAAGTHRCKLLVIGKSLHPWAFKGMTQFPVHYRANKKGCITTDITLDWFQKCFVPEARAHCNSVGLDPKCKILLILDNCSAHPKADLLVNDNVFVVYLPPSCTSLIQPQGNGIIRSMKFTYRSLFMRSLLSSVNSGTPVQKFIKEFTIKDAVYCVANAWKSVKTSTLKNGWNKLWPSLMDTSFSNEDSENNFSGVRVSKEKQLIQELLDYVEDVTNPNTKELSSRINEDVLREWMDVDDTVPPVYHYTDSEIVDMVRSLERNTRTGDEDESSDENEEDVREKISIDRLITLTTELLDGLEQQSFVSEQEIMNVYLLKDKLIRERPKYMKQ
ncbi:tigger transposable element-derived protein 2-like [Pyxicephalus adspersus]|uniref:tigger transposable element-derived protein 2-like n=1 Tax=Pyxicephalus adspersus TaxID=30357 RepID=UPI003B59C751